MPGPLFARLLTPLPHVWSHECVLRLNTNAAWVKFPTCVKFLLIPLKRSSNLIPLLSPAVSGGRWRTCYLSELSAEERGRVETWKLFRSDSSTFWNCPSCCWCELLHVFCFFYESRPPLALTFAVIRTYYKCTESQLHLDLNTLHLNTLPSYKQPVLCFLIDSLIYL